MDEKEYIERGALIETMFPIGMPNDGAYPINAKAVRVAIEKAPAADVVEVVRCGECVHRNSRSSCAADVVPRAEVEKLKNAVMIAEEEYHKLLNHYLIDTTVGNGTPLQRVTAEVARETLDKIEFEVHKLMPRKPLNENKMATITAFDIAYEKALYAVIRRLNEIRKGV